MTFLCLFIIPRLIFIFTFFVFSVFLKFIFSNIILSILNSCYFCSSFTFSFLFSFFSNFFPIFFQLFSNFFVLPTFPTSFFSSGMFLWSNVVALDFSNCSPFLLQEVLNQDAKVLELAREMFQQKSLLVMGRGYNFSTCLEGALKIKELTYMHSEGILAGELKHGPLALVDRGLPIVMVVTRDKVFSKCMNAVHEVKAREVRCAHIAWLSFFKKKLLRVLLRLYFYPPPPRHLSYRIMHYTFVWSNFVGSDSFFSSLSFRRTRRVDPSLLALLVMKRPRNTPIAMCRCRRRSTVYKVRWFWLKHTLFSARCCGFDRRG